MKLKWKFPVAVAVIAACATGLSLNGWTRGHVVEALRQLSQTTSHGTESPPQKTWPLPSSSKTKAAWDRTLTLNTEQINAIGLQTIAVTPQTEPMPLRLSGITEYDPATVTIVRTQFDCRVDKVLVEIGATVTFGQDLLEVFSNDLAEAKSNYELASSQWAHDKKVYDLKTPLARDNAIPRKELIEVVNDEAQSRLKMKLAKDKLLVFGLTEKEIENAKSEDGVEKAKMTLRSRAAGVVVQRPVVKGNYYGTADPLMTIAVLDHLWVRGSVSELDAEKIEVGQDLKVVFPFSDRTINAKVDYIDKAIDAESRSAKFRSSVPNPGNRLKSGMFVRVWVELAPKPGRAVIPRTAMVSVDRLDYVFIKKPGTVGQFERRSVFVAIERNDIVVVAEPSADHRGLVPGEEVATTGSLILEQMYEDATMEEGGLIVSHPGEGPIDSPNESVPHILTGPAMRQ